MTITKIAGNGSETSTGAPGTVTLAGVEDFTDAPSVFFVLLNMGGMTDGNTMHFELGVSSIAGDGNHSIELLDVVDSQAPGPYIKMMGPWPSSGVSYSLINVQSVGSDAISYEWALYKIS